MSIAVPLYGFGASGGTGGTLTVTAPANVTVTVSKDGKTKTKNSGTSGVVVFKGLASGTWTLKITDGSQTSSKPVVVTADYSTVIAFFAATINVTYPSGSTCTATDGTTTLTAPNTSGTWACIVPNAGTWTITATNGEKTKSGTVTITTGGETTDITLAYTLELFKDGTEVAEWTYLPRNYNVSGVANMTLANMHGKSGEGYQNRPTFYTTSKVDVTDYETLVLKLSDATGLGTIQFGAISSVPPAGTDATIPFDVKTEPPYFTGAKVISVDVSNITGKYYIALTLLCQWGSSFTAKTSDIYLA